MSAHWLQSLSSCVWKSECKAAFCFILTILPSIFCTCSLLQPESQGLRWSLPAVNTLDKFAVYWMVTLKETIYSLTHTYGSSGEFFLERNALKLLQNCIELLNDRIWHAQFKSWIITIKKQKNIKCHLSMSSVLVFGQPFVALSVESTSMAQLGVFRSNDLGDPRTTNICRRI